MRLKYTIFTLLAMMLLFSTLSHAQFAFKLADKEIQVHSFASQGFTYSTNNNFLTMYSTDGSFSMTDGGVNVSTQLTSKLRVGGQMYLRNIGLLGRWTPQLDWAYADYKFKRYFGVRGGKVKTALGLFNDTQDTDTLFTWALLPQSVYPSDLRSNFIAHTGADVYGEIPLKKAGSLNYTGYYGRRSFDSTSGYRLYAVDRGIPMDQQEGAAAGGDLRWNTPLNGLMLGSSYMHLTEHRIGHYTGLMKGAYDSYARPDGIVDAYADYTHGKWHFNGEWRKENYKLQTYASFSRTPMAMQKGNDGWFITGAYRINKLAEVGSYYSRFSLYFPYGASAKDPNADHIYDKVVTLRLDPKPWWTVKVEGHFMDGYADPYSPHGFYTRQNAHLQPDTNMLVLKTGWSF